MTRTSCLCLRLRFFFLLCASVWFGSGIGFVPVAELIPARAARKLLARRAPNWNRCKWSNGTRFILFWAAKFPYAFGDNFRRPAANTQRTEAKWQTAAERASGNGSRAGWAARRHPSAAPAITLGGAGKSRTWKLSPGYAPTDGARQLFFSGVGTPVGSCEGRRQG